MIKLIKIGIKSYKADKNKKTFTRVIREFVFLWILLKRFPLHYFSRSLYRNGYDNYMDYLSIPELMKLMYSDTIQNNFYVEILENKFLFAQIAKKFDLPVPKLLGYNSKGNFYYNQNKVKLSSNTELVLFFNEIFNYYNITKIFVKSINDHGGTGIFLLHKNNLDQQIKSSGSIILNGTFIYQECLEQHTAINKIYDISINSLRIDVCLDENEKANLLGAVMRFGAGGSAIDNVSKGGFFVPINNESGRLTKNGFGFMKHGGKVLSMHPDSEFIFDDFKIPFYKEAIKLALEMSTMFPNKIIGWDIAITPNGPFIIEGNHNTQLTMSELGYGGYKKHPLINKLL